MTVSSQAVAGSARGRDGAPGRPALVRLLGVLTVVGFVVPNALVIAYFARHGLGAAGDYFSAWTATLPATQLTLDLLICALAFLAWAHHDARRHGLGWWVLLPATFLVGLCFAIPLHLWRRERLLLSSPEGSRRV